MKLRFRILSFLLCLSIFAGMLPVMSFAAETTPMANAGTEITILPTAADATIEERAAELKTAISSLAAGKNRNGRVRLFSFTQSADGSTDMRNIKGKHYLIRNQNGTFYALNGAWTGTDGNLPTVKVTASDTTDFHYITSGISTTQAFTLTPSGKATNGMPTYYLQFNNGNYLAIGTQYTGTYTNLYNVKSSTAKYSVRFEHANNAGNFGIRNGAGTHGLRQNDDVSVYRWKDGSAGGDYSGNALYLYRLWSTTDLRAAIDEMKSYLDAPAFYKESTYTEFLTCMSDSIALFNKYNAVPTTLIDPYDYIQDTLDEQAAKLRAFASSLYFTIDGLNQSETTAQTCLYQLGSQEPRPEGDYDHSMSYIIKTRKGKIIIVDGGWERSNADGKYLFAYLREITGDMTPHVTAWFITHAHGDHHGAVATIANLYADKITVDAFYHHYPTDEQIDKYFTACDAESTKQAVRRVPYMMKKLKNSQGGAVKEVKVNSVHSGLCNSSFDFDEVHIDILLDMNDVAYIADTVSTKYSGNFELQGRGFTNLTPKELVADNFNESSIVFRATVAGKSILFTGDAGFVAGKALNLYHSRNEKNPDTYYSIQSDYVQVAHHGYYGLAKDTYQLISPSKALFPTPLWELEENPRVAYAVQWFTEMGAISYFSYKGPQTFRFPVNRSEKAVSIPAALKPYVFDAKYYADNNADLKKAYGYDEEKLYWHFVNFGIEEGRCASPFFDVKFYMNHNGQNFRDTMRGDFEKAFKHYVTNYKSSEMKRLSEIFDPTVYASMYPALADQGIDTRFELLQHYAEKNYPRGRIATTTYHDAYGAMHYDCVVTQAVTPTCTSTGRTVRIKCNCCKAILVETEALDMIDHNYVATETSATCLSGGYTTYTCTGCGDSFTNNETAALGHTEVIIDAIEPTCTASGMTEGKYCSVCNVVLVAQTEVAALSHNYVPVVTDPDCTNGGNTTYTCSNCGDSYVETTDPLGHTTVYDPPVEATCTQSGRTEGSHCAVCGMVFVAQTEIDALGHNYESVVTDPDCTSSGFTTCTCTNCGDTYTTDIVNALGHNYQITQKIDPTCTSAGSTSYACENCGDTYTDTVSASGHSIAYYPEQAATCTENGNKEYYYCANCGMYYIDAEGIYDVPWSYVFIAATGHSYNLTNSGENHTIGCDNCGFAVNEAHNYIDGTCICGAVEVTEPKYVYNSSLMSMMAISVGAEIRVNYTILGQQVKDYEHFYLEVVKEVADGETVSTTFSLSENNLSVLEYNGNVVGYNAIYTGIVASQMGDSFSATLYAVAADGTTYYGPAETSTIQNYLLEKINDEASSDEIKTLAVDMLNYGAAAQKHFGYKTEKLVNAELSEKILALGTQTLPTAIDGSVVSGSGCNVVTSVSLQSKVMLYITCLYAPSESSNMKFVVKDIDGKILEEFAPSMVGATYCQGIYDNVGASQMRKLLTIELYDNDVLVSQTLTWSIESYVASARANSASSATMVNVLNAMLVYGDSAAIYLAASGQ